MNYYEVLLPMAMILFLSKILSLGCKKIGLPQVVGMILTGILLGFIKYIPQQNIFTDAALEGLGFIAKIGVILIMCSAGLETDLKVLKQTGGKAVIITALGVIVPMLFGFGLACAFFPDASIYSKLFYGVILTATSVSVTVATLKELGKLNTPIGTAIVSAAILDDIIGIVLLSLISGLSSGQDQSEDVLGKLFAPIFTGGLSALGVIIKILLFFVLIIASGLILHFIFKKLDVKFHNHRRLAIFGFAACFLYAFLAEKVFGIADITGAFFSGLMISGLGATDYVDRKIDQSCYLIFAPVFFANIGINCDFSGITGTIALFGLCYAVLALLGKFIGCGAGALICKSGWKDSIRAGVGMMARAEVVLVCTQKGVDYGLVDRAIYPFIILLIIISSFIVPIFLKLTYKKEPPIDGSHFTTEAPQSEPHAQSSAPEQIPVENN